MNYIIIEMQTTDGVTAIVPPVVKSNYNEAEQEYHTKLAYAAVSAVHLHSVTMLAENGKMIKCEAYDHAPAPEPAEE